MAAASHAQYAWTFFVTEIQEQHGWERAQIQFAFTLFVLVQTWGTPLVGTVIDWLGPRIPMIIGGVFAGLAWILNSSAITLNDFYIAQAIGGVGVGCVYATCINNAIKWFPDKRGMAVGFTAGGYGSGTVLTIIPIANMIESAGYQATFLTFGILQGAVILALALFIRAPQQQVKLTAAPVVAQSGHNFTVLQALGTPVFWVMLIMFTLTVTGGLMATAQLRPMATDYGVGDVQMNFVLFSMSAIAFAAVLDRVMNGVSRPLFGFISDRIGREKTMFLAFSIEGLGIMALATFGTTPWAFVILSGVVFLAWGEVYSLFSATAGDAFGTKHIGKIYGLLYCAKGIAALLVPFGNRISEATGSWATVLYAMAGMDILAALTALFVLRPILLRHHRRIAGGSWGRSDS
jgi:oxalate/formate antiporter